MQGQFEVVYENGVLRPLTPLPLPLQEHQHLTVTIETPNGASGWLADADATVSLESVRQALAKVPGTLAQWVHDEREDRS
jgi:predicted DNA-binding antitoxin AbrB/MazE fold protein